MDKNSEVIELKESIEKLIAEYFKSNPDDDLEIKFHGNERSLEEQLDSLIVRVSFSCYNGIIINMPSNFNKQKETL